MLAVGILLLLLLLVKVVTFLGLVLPALLLLLLLADLKNTFAAEFVTPLDELLDSWLIGLALLALLLYGMIITYPIGFSNLLLLLLVVLLILLWLLLILELLPVISDSYLLILLPLLCYYIFA